eukprot:TRINITY_DN887_c0_g1_i1.p1 TRINITY_DN887_c0_g1~~TRINITY_DN887_c0_g1_i1.p1  ORF type:complete len:175 (+),score=36.96 TRINITY_DN887_c0_g1_i1:57-581(+)
MQVECSVTLRGRTTIPSFILETNVKSQAWQKYWWRTSHNFEEEWSIPFKKQYSQEINVEIFTDEYIRVKVFASNPTSFLDQLAEDNMTLPLKFKSRDIKVTTVDSPQYHLTSQNVEELHKMRRRYLSEANKTTNDTLLMEKLAEFYKRQDEMNLLNILSERSPIDSSEDSSENY